MRPAFKQFEDHADGKCQDIFTSLKDPTVLRDVCPISGYTRWHLSLFRRRRPKWLSKHPLYVFFVDVGSVTTEFGEDVIRTVHGVCKSQHLDETECTQISHSVVFNTQGRKRTQEHFGSVFFSQSVVLLPTGKLRPNYMYFIHWIQGLHPPTPRRWKEPWLTILHRQDISHNEQNVKFLKLLTHVACHMFRSWNLASSSSDNPGWQFFFLQNNRTFCCSFFQILVSWFSREVPHCRRHQERRHLMKMTTLESSSATNRVRVSWLTKWICKWCVKREKEQKLLPPAVVHVRATCRMVCTAQIEWITS